MSRGEPIWHGTAQHAYDRQNWRANVHNLRVARERHQRDAAIMTPLELRDSVEALKAQLERVYGDAVRGALGEFNSEVERYEGALANTSKARADETCSWDMVKLAATRQSYKTRLDAMQDKASWGGATRAEQARQLLGEALDADDKYHTRAINECLDIAATADHGLASLARQARAALAGERNTAAIRGADKNAALEWDKLTSLRDELLAADEVLNGSHGGFPPTGDLARAISRLRPGGVVLPEDDVHVTHVDMSRVNAGEAVQDVVEVHGPPVEMVRK